MDKTTLACIILVVACILGFIWLITTTINSRARIAEEQVACYELGGEWVVESEARGYCWHEDMK